MEPWAHKTNIISMYAFHLYSLYFSLSMSENITSFKSTTQEVTIPGDCKQEACEAAAGAMKHETLCGDGMTSMT